MVVWSYTYMYVLLFFFNNWYLSFAQLNTYLFFCFVELSVLSRWIDNKIIRGFYFVG